MLPQANANLYKILLLLALTKVVLLIFLKLKLIAEFR